MKLHNSKKMLSHATPSVTLTRNENYKNYERVARQRLNTVAARMKGMTKKKKKKNEAITRERKTRSRKT